MNQRLVGAELDSDGARFPVHLNQSRQTVAPIQAPLQKGSRIPSGETARSEPIIGELYSPP